MSPTKKEPCESRKQVLLHGFFPAYGFGNPQTYKIKNTRNGNKIGLWMSFGYLLDFLNGYDKYQELSFPTDCGEILERYLFVKRKCITPPWPS